MRGPSSGCFALSPRERQAYMKDLEAIGQQVIAELENGQEPRDDRFSSRVLQLLMGRERTTFCGAGRTIFGIVPDGTVLPCVLVDAEQNRLGYIADDPATWVDAGERWVVDRQPRVECRKCPAFSLCGGGCPAILPICGEDECELVRKNCEVATTIFEHFRTRPGALLALAGIV